MSSSRFSASGQSQTTSPRGFCKEQTGNSTASDKGRSPTSELWKNAAGYFGAIALTVTLLTVTMQLWRADLTVPFGYAVGDGAMFEALVQATMEKGWFWDNDRLGAPGGQNMCDFPIPDVLHFGIIKLLGYVFPNPAVVMNLYYLLPYPLTAFTAYFVLRRFKMGRMAAIAASVLYACAPYHFWRMLGHPMLAAYYLLPLTTWVIVRLYLGRQPLFRFDSTGGEAKRRWWNWATAGDLLLCALTGIGGIYYAFFTCFLLLAAGVKAALRDRRCAPLGTAAVLILVIAGVLGAGLSPSLLYMSRNGKNHESMSRAAVEADIHGLNVSEMFLPMLGHRVRALERVREKYLEGPRSPLLEGPVCSSLGCVASVGFLWLIGRFVLRRHSKVERVEDALAYLTAVAVLLGTVGGLGASFNFYVTPMIRCYNRLSIYLAFFALAGLFLVLQRLASRYARSRLASSVYFAGLGAILLLGSFDQTSPLFIPNYAEAKSQYIADAEFGKRMDAALPAGSLVYQLPYMPYPEALPVHQLAGYDLFRPYFHTRTLRWSYGTIRGREASRRQAALAELPLAESLPELAYAGFSGIYLDRTGFEDNGAAAEAELSRLLSVEPQVSLTGRQAFFDMTGYVQALRGRSTESEWGAKREAAVHSMTCVKPTQQ